MPTYAAGSWGPREADELIEEDGVEWREPQSDRLHRLSGYAPGRAIIAPLPFEIDEALVSDPRRPA